MMPMDPAAAAVDDSIIKRNESSSSRKRQQRSSRKSASEDDGSHSKTNEDDPFVVIHSQIRSPTSVMSPGRLSTPSSTRRKGQQRQIQAFDSSFTSLPISDYGDESNDSNSRFNNSFANTFDLSFPRPKSPAPRIVLESKRKAMIASIKSRGGMPTMSSPKPSRSLSNSSSNQSTTTMRTPRHATSPPKRHHSGPLSPLAPAGGGMPLPNIPDLNRSFLHTVDTDKLKINKKKKDSDVGNEDCPIGNCGFGIHSNRGHCDDANNDDDDWVQEEGFKALQVPQDLHRLSISPSCVEVLV